MMPTCRSAPAISSVLKAKLPRLRHRARDPIVLLSRTMNKRDEVVQILKARLVVPLL
jgi:hypothetical protein